MRFLAIFALIQGSLTVLTSADTPKPKPPPVAALVFPPLAPTYITWEKSGSVLGEVADALEKKSGVPIAIMPASLKKTKCDVRFKDAPFWEAMQTVANHSATRIALAEGGRKVELVPRGNTREAATTSGAFRVVAHQVVGRALLDQGVTFHEVHLLVHWEPRLRVYRIDTAPKIRKVADVQASKIIVEGGSAQVLPSNATSEMKVKLHGLTRSSERITTLAGEFTVTAAEKLLAFAFEAPNGKLPEVQKQDDVAALLKRVQKKDDTWEVVVEVTYPPNQPVFESFQGEWWLRENRMSLVAPNGKAVAIDDYEVPTPDRTRPLVVIHRFKEDAATGFGNPTTKGWKIVYETPSPLAEVKIPFELKDIPLP